jgi:hypothetical protein
MKGRIFASLVLALGTVVGMAGCGEESSVTRETKIETPEGSKTITQQEKVETTGDAATGTGTTP